MNSALGAKMSPESSTVQYTIDQERSRFTVRAFAGGLLSGFGHNPQIALREVSGEVNFASGAIPESSMRLRLKPDSFAVQNDVSDKDRREIERMMKDEVLEVGRFPEITFESRQVSGMQLGESMYMLKIEGELTLHGATRTQSISAQVVPSDDSVRAQGEFAIKQSDFNIKLVSVAGGALKVKDELKFAFDIVAVKAG
jgi:polyisoprenoid-binding protein YceI